MTRLLLACSLFGCGLVLDLDPENEPHADAGKIDAAENVEAGLIDALPKPDTKEDALSVDAGEPLLDGMVVRFDGGEDAGDAGELDAGELDAGELDAGEPDVAPSCVTDTDCGESTECLSWTCDGGTCRSEMADLNTPCREDLFCTRNMSCQEGVCTGGTPRECDGGVSRCSMDVCDEAADRCLPMPTNEGMECSVPNGVGACMGGDCGVISCDPSFLACGDPPECIDPQISLFHCGGCNTGCSEVVQVCLLGVCVGI